MRQIPMLPRCVFIALLLAAAPATSAPRAFAYLSPLPGSDMVSCWNNVAIRQGDALDPSSVDPRSLSVTGSVSGRHSGRLRLASDGRTLLFTPDAPYALGERVRVQLERGTRALLGTEWPALDYTFRVSRVDPRSMPHTEPERLPDPPDAAAWWREPSLTAAGACDTLLPGFPALHAFDVAAPNPGVYFLAPYAAGNQTQANLEIMDERGQPVFERAYAGNRIPVDFKMQPDGRLTFWMNGTNRFLVLDSAYARVDSFVTGNGYLPDLHDLQFLPNGHVLMIAYDPEPVGMDTVVAGGDPSAIVTGLIVQELDELHDVVFQWRSWDHFKITDASVSPLVNLQANLIDYVHGNAVGMAPDGNIVISCRHMNEVTKIDRQTGDIRWRMGLHAVNNQFSFPNDARGFSHQHDARILPNGHLTVFDNGNFLSPEYSRALEFSLDEENRVATLVWEYRHTPDIYASFMGDVQRHEDGATTIGWGGTTDVTRATDLHVDHTTALEVSSPPGYVDYRVFRQGWRTNRFLTDAQDLDIAAAAVGQSAGLTVKVWNHWDQPIHIDCLRTADPSVFTALPAGGTLPVTLAPGETTEVQVVYAPVSPDPASSRLYIVEESTEELVAQTVELHGHIDAGAGVGPGTGAPLAIATRPNPVRRLATIDFTLAAPGRARLEMYDAAGRRVATLARGRHTAGPHEAEWDVGSNAPGLYFCRLRAGGRTLMRKVVVAG